MLQFNTKIFPKSRGVYIVGGSIRDLLRGQSPIDYDVAVKVDPLRFAHQVAKKTKGRVVEIGKPGQRIFRVVSDNMVIDVSRIKGATIEEDLQARDFSVNAMAYDVYAHQLIDDLGGQQDLANKTIRMVSKNSFKKDPVRLLRAFRIAATLQFEIEAETRSVIEKNAALIQQSAAERVRDELFKMFQSTRSYPYLCRLADIGLLFTILPELLGLKQCRQNRYHQFDAFEHTLKAYYHLERLLDPAQNQKLLIVKGAPGGYLIAESRVPLMKFSILLHDIGKPVAQTTDNDGDVHFYGHEHQSALMAEAICKRLKCSTRNADAITFLVRHHTRPLSLFNVLETKNKAPRAVTRFFIQCAAHIPALLICAIADMLGKAEEKNDRTRGFIKFANQLLADFETERPV